MNIVMLDSLTLGEFDTNIFSKLGNFSFYPTTKSDEVIPRCKDADIVIVNKVVLDANIIESLSNLKLICVAATGTNNIDLETAKKRGIPVKNVVGYSTYSVAQHTLTLALNLLSKLTYYSQYVASGEWAKSEIFCHLAYPIIDLKDKEWGIIGLGNIGRQVCHLVKAFGARVSYHSTSGNIQAGIQHKSIESLLQTSDIISIHAPFNPKTQNLIADKELRLLKKGAILLNLGRGGIVNEQDLAARLKEQDFYFGSDVLEKEPMIPNHPLLNPDIASKVIITPHIAWAYKDTKDKLISMVVDNIKEFLRS
ncbi:D-2-hydroxyacid dehydrogenase [Helicobacter muridarum]|uniref:2-hydroxyacid dehydrogenase n=1 Tax=Helicobacter muridarum TaxID=216 RepID=A0A099U1X8_9HELI|nr:D-2-hydroxyacid dehydrogenase [Helicobacter muridarum]TLD99832.1 D-2-hydroxyacid dehydrogenase [Helicobacter muridarum]STQ86959.1 2-hydroxyacid dehydrogenase [Helicobacter muridarum]